MNGSLPPTLTKKHVSYVKDLGENLSMTCRVIVFNPCDQDGRIPNTFGECPHLKISGIWDTGCTMTSVDVNIAKDLNLHLIGMDNVNTAAGLVERATYLAGIVIEGDDGFLWHHPIPTLIGEVSLASCPSKALIGMDIIRNMEFAISHRKFSWCHPPYGNPINLSQKADKANEKIRKKRQR